MKPSNLTRSVFRALITNQPYIPRDCLRRQIHTRPLPSWPRKVHRQQRRTLFRALLDSFQPSLLQDSKATARNVERALEKLSDLVRARRARARAPVNEELIDATKFLCKARKEMSMPMTRTEVYLATETYKHLQERDMILSEENNSMVDEDLLLVMDALAIPNAREQFRSDVRALAELIYAQATSTELRDALLPSYAAVLATTGSAQQARQVLTTSQVEEHATRPNLWTSVLLGLLQEGRAAEFWQLLQEIQDRSGSISARMQEQIMGFFHQRNNVWDAERLLAVPVAEGQSTSLCLRKILELALRDHKVNLAQTIRQKLFLHDTDEDALSAIILLQASQSQSPQELEANISELLHGISFQTNMSSFNSIIAYALKQDELPLANSLLRLAESLGLHPDGKTCALRLQFALVHDDLQLASKMYDASLLEDVPEDGSDLPILNQYAAKLAFDNDANYNQVMRIVDTLLERGAELHVDVVAGLCRMFLRREELEQAQGILKYRTDLMPAQERAQIANVFREFILDPDLSDQRAYNVYEVFRYEFPETPASDRLKLMQAFFDRKRPEFACTVFSHMRQCDPGDPGRPDTVSYQKCFEGIAQCRDVDGLESVLNMLKLDLHIDMSTRVRNGIMLAYIACQMPWQAIMDHFYKIMDSREGPSYSTFEVAMRACETWPPYGSFEARKIIAVMQAWNLEITKEMYDTYVGVIAGQCEFENAVELVEEMEAETGELPDAFTIGTFYNAIPWQFRKDEVEKWAKQAYPELWAQLLTYGEEIDEEFEVRYFKLDRSIDIDDEPLFRVGEWKPELARQAQAKIEPLPLKV